jgi:hypothetical protein
MLKYNSGKIRYWVHQFFRDNFSSAVYIVSKELNQDLDAFDSWEIVSQIKYILLSLA